MEKYPLGRGSDSIALGKEVFNMKSPIIVDENGDISFYSSNEQAQSYLEPVDVKANEYVGYDADGVLLSITADDEYSVRIDLRENSPLHAEILRSKLESFLLLLGEPVDSTDLQTLISLCAGYIKAS